MKLTKNEKQYIYETVMSVLEPTVRRLMEDVTILGVKMKSAIQPTMDELTDLDDAVPYNDKKLTDDIQNLYKKMFTSKYGFFLKQNNMDDRIQWSYKLDTACTNGYDGHLIMNPNFAQTVYNQCGENGIFFIILHETMHNYYNNVKHTQKIVNPSDNIIIDRQINSEIIRRWPELKDIPRQLGLLLPN